MEEIKVNKTNCTISSSGQFNVQTVVKAPSLSTVPKLSKRLVSYHVASHVQYAISKGLPQKKGIRPVVKETKIKLVKGASFVNHCLSAKSVPNVPNVAKELGVGGRLQTFWPKWQELGANPRVVSILKEGYALPFKMRPPLTRFPLIKSGYANPVRSRALSEALVALREKLVVEKVVVRASLSFYNRLFLIPKPNKKWRPILDLSQLNVYLQTNTFKMETPETIRVSLQTGEWVTSLDFSDAYFHIPIHTRSRKYLRFFFEQQGISVHSPSFRSSHCSVGIYQGGQRGQIDGSDKGYKNPPVPRRLVAQSPVPETCQRNTQTLLALCRELGWVVNMKESKLVPQQVFNFVGYRFDLLTGWVLPTTECWETLKAKLLFVKNRDSCMVRQFMSLIGHLTATEKQVWLGRLHMRPIQSHLKKHWHVPEVLDKVIPVPPSLHLHLDWWLDEKNVLRGQPLHTLRHALQVFTDASNEGWGAHLGETIAKGVWSEPESHLHINFLELKAVFLTLKSFEHLCRDQIVLIATDNTTVVSYINKQGGMRSGSLCALLWRLLSWCHLRGIVLRAKHILGCLNVIAANYPGTVR